MSRFGVLRAGREDSGKGTASAAQLAGPARTSSLDPSPLSPFSIFSVFSLQSRRAAQLEADRTDFSGRTAPLSRDLEGMT